jgi:hypothetical protein
MERWWENRTPASRNTIPDNASAAAALLESVHDYGTGQRSYHGPPPLNRLHPAYVAQFVKQQKMGFNMQTAKPLRGTCYRRDAEGHRGRVPADSSAGAASCFSAATDTVRPHIAIDTTVCTVNKTGLAQRLRRLRVLDAGRHRPVDGLLYDYLG